MSGEYCQWYIVFKISSHIWYGDLYVFDWIEAAGLNPPLKALHEVYFVTGAQNPFKIHRHTYIHFLKDIHFSKQCLIVAMQICMYTNIFSTTAKWIHFKFYTDISYIFTWIFLIILFYKYNKLKGTLKLEHNFFLRIV